MSKFQFKLLFFMQNWKMVIHLLFRTKRFGVNNRWWSTFDSDFGWPWWKIVHAIVTIRPLISNYQGMCFRAKACKFVSQETLIKLGWEKPGTEDKETEDF